MYELYSAYRKRMGLFIYLFIFIQCTLFYLYLGL